MYDTAYDFRRQNNWLNYADDRLGHLRQRAVFYGIAGLVLASEVGLAFAALAFALVSLGEAVECWGLHRMPHRLNHGATPKRVFQTARAISALQALTLSAATAVYVWAAGHDASIMAVIGVLSMACINAAVALPTKRAPAIAKLAVFVATPLLLVLMQALRFGNLHMLWSLNTADGLMLAGMVYMYWSFVHAGTDSSSKSAALKRSQMDLSSANKKLSAHQRELQKLSMVARTTNDAVILMGANRRVEWVNEAFTTLTGVPEHGALGRQVTDLIKMTQGSLANYTNVFSALRDGTRHRSEVKNELHDGSVRWIELQSLPVTDGADEIQFFVLIARDITAEKESRETMLLARTTAEDAVRTKSEFLANMSHEIRTPMTGIIGMADLLAETDQTPEQAQFTQTIIGSSRSLLTIINDILDLSKLDPGKLDIHANAFSVRKCFEETLSLLEPKTRDKDLTLTLEFDPNVPEHLLADDVRIRQIATNIVGNATKFTEQGRVDVSVWTDTKKDQMTLHFSVQDTGVGIPSDTLGGIFDQFSQAESSTTRQFGGTGLGLAICRVLAERMGGHIEVTSTYGEGSCFHVRLPVAVPVQQALPVDVPVQIQPTGTDNLNGVSVLVAEDNKTNRLLISKFLEPLPITLRFAHDGFEAVESALDSPPDLIFMDMSMPTLSGIEATEAIRSSDIPQPKIVALTANAFASEKQACLRAGMDDFLTKPVRRAELVACLQRHVGRQAQGELQISVNER